MASDSSKVAIVALAAGGLWLLSRSSVAAAPVTIPPGNTNPLTRQMIQRHNSAVAAGDPSPWTTALKWLSQAAGAVGLGRFLYKTVSDAAGAGEKVASFLGQKIAEQGLKPVGEQLYQNLTGQGLETATATDVQSITPTDWEQLFPPADSDPAVLDQAAQDWEQLFPPSAPPASGPPLPEPSPSPLPPPEPPGVTGPVTTVTTSSNAIYQPDLIPPDVQEDLNIGIGVGSYSIADTTVTVQQVQTPLGDVALGPGGSATELGPGGGITPDVQPSSLPSFGTIAEIAGAVGAAVSIVFDITGDFPDAEKALNAGIDTAALALLVTDLAIISVPFVGWIVGALEIFKFAFDFLFGGSGMTEAQREAYALQKTIQEVNLWSGFISWKLTPSEMWGFLLGVESGAHEMFRADIGIASNDPARWPPFKSAAHVARNDFDKVAVGLLSKHYQVTAHIVEVLPLYAAKLEQLNHYLAKAVQAQIERLYLARIGMAKWVGPLYENWKGQMLQPDGGFLPAYRSAPFGSRYTWDAAALGDLGRPGGAPPVTRGLITNVVPSVAMIREEPFVAELIWRQYYDPIAQWAGARDSVAFLDEALAPEWREFVASKPHDLLPNTFAIFLGFPSFIELRVAVFQGKVGSGGALMAVNVEALVQQMNALNAVVLAMLNLLAVRSAGGYVVDPNMRQALAALQAGDPAGAQAALHALLLAQEAAAV